MTPRKRFYLKIKEAPIPARSLPAGMRDSEEFGQLLGSGIIRREKRGRGYVYQVAEQEAFAAFLEANFPVEAVAEGVVEGAANVAHYRDSKARQRPGKRIFLLRGRREVIVNDITVGLEEHTANFGFFAASIRKAVLGKVCSVENLDVFMAAEDVLGDSWTFLHPYGRIGQQPIRGIQAEEWLHFPDYDYTGLEEYLRIKEVHPHAQLYLPDNLEALHHRFSKPMKAGARMKKRARTSQLPEVARVRSLLEKTGRFLEQEILLHDIKS
ncbi:MAG: hypothetical protein KDD06_07435 [Phaeodactylibacter sp.]|nr:hypothetical protein [Phaeodactylibacter sp.]MCB9266655.1 hypothetical protein [Lewinellaceae bacterium]MCB9290328.1 hypothetical protein [Lewinellaceae bacterium]